MIQNRVGRTWRATASPILYTLFASLGALALAACAQGIDPPEETPMVAIRGLSSLPVGAPMRFIFGDEEGCPKADCTPGGTIVFAYPTIEVEVQPFSIDAHEVTNRQYEYCVEFGACDEVAGFNLDSADIEGYYRNGRYANHPVVNMTPVQAAAYCAFVGKRLPTELEWEFVVRSGGTNSEAWPFGDSLDDCELKDIAAFQCNTDTTRPVAVGTATDDVIHIATVDGVVDVYDMIGNVSEWMGHPYVRQLTCDFDAAFEAECGKTCEDACNGEGACVSSCHRMGTGGSCSYCDPATGSTKDCFTVCDLATCVRKVSTFVLQHFDPWPEHLASDPMKPFVDGETYPIRGGNFFSGKFGTKKGVWGTCALRSSYRNNNIGKDEAKDFVGFRCAQDI